MKREQKQELNVYNAADFKFLLFCLLILPSISAKETQNTRSVGSNPSQGKLVGESPTFIIEPDELYYIVKNKPVTLVCRVVGASKVNFKCGDKWIDPTHQVTKNGTDVETGHAYQEILVDIYKEEIEEYNKIKVDPYSCECSAWGSNVQVPYKTSRRSLLRIAYLRRYFEREPLSVSVEFESPVQLQCLPPQGVPYPETYWLKNNEKIEDRKEINYIITSEGDLIINQARFSDQANYTCVAENIASRRYSEPALLTVHVSGGWSVWSGWTECPLGCGGRQFRRRWCNSPEPQNGGAGCVGEGEQERPCSKPCPVNGAWSPWTSWSPCGSNCQRYRRRACDNPPPSYGGSSCSDHDLDTEDCCNSSTSTIHDEERSSMDIVPYVSLAVAVVVCVMVVSVIVLVLLLRHRRLRHHGSSESKVQPDITQTVVPFLHVAHYSSDRSRDYCPDDDVMSCQLLYQRVPESGESDTTTDHSCPYNDSDSSMSHQGSIKSCDPIVWNSVPYTGGRLDIPRSNVSLTLPEGAVKNPTEFFLTVCRDDSDKMRLPESHTHLSPVVGWGCRPPVRLEKPGVMTFEHCACLETGQAQNWSLCLYGCDTSSSKTWKIICAIEGQASSSSDQKTFVHVDKSHCHIVTCNMMRYALIGQPKYRQPASKYIQLAAFASNFLPSTTEHSLRIYFVEDTADALELILDNVIEMASMVRIISIKLTEGRWDLVTQSLSSVVQKLQSDKSVVEIEGRLGSSLLGCEKSVIFEHGCGNLCLSLEILEGFRWICRRTSSYQEVPFTQIWSMVQSGLHCSFTLEFDYTTSPLPSLVRPSPTLTCAVQVYQKSLPERYQTLVLALNKTKEYTSQMTNSPAFRASDFKQEHLGIV